MLKLILYYLLLVRLGSRLFEGKKIYLCISAVRLVWGKWVWGLMAM